MSKQTQKFICNAEDKTLQLQSFTCNQSGAVRYDNMGGREYRVAPMVMMAEGVLTANAGAILYTKEDIGKAPGLWNNKPVVVYHPQANGRGISACSPDIISNRGVGVIMNAHVGEVDVDGVSKVALKAEAWVEIDRAAIVDNRVVEAIDNEAMMEVSTGLLAEIEYAEGEFNGESYIGIAHNYQPDHLALLPDIKGACSIAAGAGFIRNEKAQTLTVNYSAMDKDVKSYFENPSAQLVKTFMRVVRNEMSYDNTMSLIRSKLWDTYEDSWVDEVYDTFFIYEKDGELFKQSYLITEGVCSFVGEAVPVEKVTEYRTKDGKIIGNRKDQSMEKSKIVDGLIANANTSWDVSDREALMAMNETTLGKLVANATKPEESAEAPAEAEVEAETTGTEEVTGNSANMSVDEYLDNHVPAELRSSLKSAMTTERKIKKSIINGLISNDNCNFTAEYLQTKDVEELQNLHTLANGKSDVTPEKGVVRFDYGGQGGQLLNSDETTSVVNEEPLGLPSMV